MVAICYCVPAKGIAIGVPLSLTIFNGLSLDLESKIQIPIIIYQGIQLVFGSILISIFRKWVDSQKPESQDATVLGQDSGKSGADLSRRTLPSYNSHDR